MATLVTGKPARAPYVTGEDVSSVQLDLEKIKTKLEQRSFASIDDIRTLVCEELSGLVGTSTLCGLELALLDAWSQENETPLPFALDAKMESPVTYSGIVPLQHSSAALEQLQHFSFTAIKLKVDRQLSDSLHKIQQIRQYFGQDIDIRLDANCSWQYEDALQQIPVFLAEGVNSFEQIFAKGQEMQMGKITQQFGKEALIMADESVTTLAQAQLLLDRQLVNSFNLKISKNGGIFNTLKIYTLAQQYGIPCQLGAHFGETSILTAAGHLLAGLADFTFHEGGFGTHLLREDLGYPALSINVKGEIHRKLNSWSKGGWGFTVQPTVLDRYGSLLPSGHINVKRRGCT